MTDAELRALAEEATEGSGWYDSTTFEAVTSAEGDDKFIAACRPHTILGLLDRLGAAEQALQKIASVSCGLHTKDMNCPPCGARAWLDEHGTISQETQQ